MGAKAGMLSVRGKLRSTRSLLAERERVREREVGRVRV